MENPHLNRKEISLNAEKMNFRLFAFLLPVLIVFVIPYSVFWHINYYDELYNILINNIISTLGLLFSGVIAHELIHGLFWSFYLKKGFRSIRFGIMWSSFTPYCHSKEPMKLKHYRLGAIMPAVLLGFVPSFISIFTGNFACLIFGIFFSIAAGADLLMIWMLRKENRNDWVQDHPDKVGCYIYKKTEETK